MEYFKEHYITILLTAFYVFGCLYIGWYFKKKASKEIEGYYLAKREIPGWVISLAFFSTSASTNTYIGQAGKSFEYGLSWAWMGFIWTIFCIISWQLLGPRMRFQTARLKSFTIPDYFHLRYKSNLAKSIRMLSATIILFATLWYMIGIAKGCAHVLTSVLDIPYEYGAFAILFITCAYTIWGGMYSVLWTDAIQGIIMFGVAILMLMIPFIYAGGVEPLLENLRTTDHLTASGAPIGSGLVVFGELTSFLYILGIGLAIGMKQISEPKNLIRFYSINNAKSMRFAMIWTPVFLGISLVCVMGLGALVHGMANASEASYLVANTDEVVGFMLDKFDNKLVSGICVAGLFAAGMSSTGFCYHNHRNGFCKRHMACGKTYGLSKNYTKNKMVYGPLLLNSILTHFISNGRDRRAYRFCRRCFCSEFFSGHLWRLIFKMGHRPGCYGFYAYGDVYKYYLAIWI